VSDPDLASRPALPHAAAMSEHAAIDASEIDPNPCVILVRIDPVITASSDSDFDVLVSP
jgi:hypothetical protein